METGGEGLHRSNTETTAGSRNNALTAMRWLAHRDRGRIRLGNEMVHALSQLIELEAERERGKCVVSIVSS